MTKKRLLFISNLFPNPCEPQRATYNMQQVAALQEFYDIDIVAPIAWPLRLRNAQIPSLRNFNGSRVFHPTYWYPPGMCRALYGQFFFNSIKRTIYRANQDNPFDAVMGSWLYPDGWAANRLARAMEVPFFVKVHGTDVNRLQPGSAITRKSLVGIKGVDGIISVSAALKSRLMSLGVPDGKISVVYNGIDQKIFSPRPVNEARQLLGIDGGIPILLFVGNLKKDKGLGELASAFSELVCRQDLSNCRLVIIGRGPFEEEFKKRLENFGVFDRCYFAGSLAPGKVALWMNAASTLCLPSYMEGVPNVILEALACGLPVVATNVGGIPELAEKSNLLQMVEPEDVDGLVNKLHISLQGPEALLPCRSFPTWRENAQQIQKVIDRVLVTLNRGKGGPV